MARTRFAGEEIRGKDAKDAKVKGKGKGKRGDEIAELLTGPFIGLFFGCGEVGDEKGG